MIAIQTDFLHKARFTTLVVITMPAPSGFFYDSPTAFYDVGLVYDLEPAPTPKPKTKMASLNLSLSRKNPSELVALGELVVTKLAPAAPATPPIPNLAAKVALLSTVKTAARTTNDAYENAKAALVNLKLQRDNGANALRVELAAVSKAVESEARGDAMMLSVSGFDLAADPSNTGAPPAKVLNLNVTASDADGQLNAQHDPVAYARSYDLPITTVDPVAGPWELKGSQTTAKCTITVSLAANGCGFGCVP